MRAMQNNMNERRQFHRILYKKNATLSNKSTELACKVIDISLKGCLLRLSRPWIEALEETYTLRFQLSEDKAITMQVSVAHVIGNDIGFKCEHIDIDSISLLRRLVELNLGDEKILERDFLALSGVGA
jgi:hypothetical protein